MLTFYHILSYTKHYVIILIKKEGEFNVWTTITRQADFNEAHHAAIG